MAMFVLKKVQGEERILIQMRAGGKFGFPCGRMEAVDNGSEKRAQIRETKEEAGLTIDPNRVGVAAPGAFFFTEEPSGGYQWGYPLTPNETKPVEEITREIPNAIVEFPPSRHAWVTVNDIKERIHKFAWNHGQVAVEFLERRAAKRPRTEPAVERRVATKAVRRYLTVFDMEVDTGPEDNWGNKNWVNAHDSGNQFDGWQVDTHDDGTTHFSMMIQQNQTGPEKRMYLSVWQDEDCTCETDNLGKSNWVCVHEAGNRFSGWHSEKQDDGTYHYWMMVEQDNEGPPIKVYLTVWETDDDTRPEDNYGCSSWVRAHEAGNQFPGWKLEKRRDGRVELSMLVKEGSQ